jgi:dTDP-4-amino-4,6-dideoxygalactose transaminase
LFSIFREQGHHLGECPVAEDIFRRKLISLPLGPTMKIEDANYTVKVIKEIIHRIKKSSI